MVNIENVKKFVRVLRSGEFHQIYGSLYDSHHPEFKRGRCCALGCAGETIYFEDTNEYCELPTYSDINNWLGFNSENKKLDIPPKLCEKYQTASSRAEVIVLNDDYHLTFDEIADCLEYTFGDKSCVSNKYEPTEYEF